ncbi:MAG: tetratricopeptide repeat protein [Vulcanimicrobiota bacterium]
MRKNFDHMEEEVSSIQRFTKIAGGSLDTFGFRAEGDYGRLFIPWNQITHLALVLFEKAQKGVISPYLLIFTRNEKTQYYIDGFSVNYRDLLEYQTSEIQEYNLKMLIKRIASNLFFACFDTPLLEYLKGGTHLLRRFTNFNLLGRHCDEIRAVEPTDENLLDRQNSRYYWDFSLSERLTLALKWREESQRLTAVGYRALTKPDMPVQENNDKAATYPVTLKTPAEYFSFASAIDPWFHLPHACRALCEISQSNYQNAFNLFEKAVALLPYPGGITEAFLKVYYQLLKGIVDLSYDDEECFAVCERLLGFSPRSGFAPLLCHIYTSPDIKPEWYTMFFTAFFCISQKRYADSLEPLESTLSMNPEFPWTYHWQGVSLSRMGRPHEARRAFEKILATVPSSHSSVELYYLQKNKEDIAAVISAREANPSSAWPYYILGSHAGRIEKDHSKCQLYFLRSLALDNHSPFINSMLQEADESSTQKESSQAVQTRVDLKRGDLLGDRYEITKVLKGGMGVVYIAYDSSTSTPYAIKTFQEQFLWNNSIKNMFIREAETWIKLDIHENIVQAIFIKLYEERPFLFLEYIRGTDLESILESRALSLEETLHYCIQFCTGMSYAYNKLGIIHRDIKPSNCLISEHNVLKITDFGLVRVFTDRAEGEMSGLEEALAKDNRHKITSAFLGTIPYMAPERLIYMDSGSIRSDIYSFGVMIYQMLTRQLPYSPTQLAENHTVIISEDYLPLTSIRSDIPVDFSDMVDTCLEKEPENRYADFDELKIVITSLYEKYTQSTFASRTTTQTISTDTLITKGNSLLNISKYPEALECFKSVLSSDPHNLTALTGIGNTYLHMQQFNEALQYFDTILSLAPGADDVMRNKGIALLELGRFEEAFKSFETVLARNPQDAVSLWKSGRIFYHLGWHSEALAFLNRSLECSGKAIEVLNDKGLLLHSMGRPEEAIQYYDKALELNPTFIKSLTGKARVLFEIAEFQSAIDIYKLVLSVDEIHREALLGIALSLGKLEQHNESLPFYQSLCTLYPNDREVILNKSRSLKSIGLLEDALNSIDELEGDSLEDVDVVLEKGLLLKELFFYDEAQRELERAAQANPSSHTTAHNLEEIRKDKMILEEVMRQFREFLSLSEDRLPDLHSALKMYQAPDEAFSMINSFIYRGFRNPVVLKAKSSVLREMGRFTEALIALDSIPMDSADDESLRIERDRITVLMKDKKKSKDHMSFLKKLISTSQADPYGLFLKGLELYRKGQFKEAGKSFEESLKHDPENSEGWYYEALALKETGFYGVALECLKNALTLDKSKAEAKRAEGEIHEKMGMYAECLESYNAALLLNPLSLETWMLMIDYLEELGHSRKAKLFSMAAHTVLSRLMEENADNYDLLPMKALLEYSLGRLNASLKSCREMEQKRPEEKSVLYVKALILSRSGDNYGIFTALRELLKKDEHHIPSLTELGHTHKSLKEFDEALKCFDKILSISRDNEYAYYIKSLTLFEMDQPEEGLLCLDLMRESFSRSCRAWKAKGLFHERRGQDDESLWSFNQAIQNNSLDFISHFNLVILMNRTGRHDEVLRIIEELEKIEPYNPLVAIQRGDSCALAGMVNEAFNSYDRAIRIDPHQIMAYIHKAHLMSGNGRFEEAMQTMHEAVELFPARASLLNNAAVILFQTGQLTDALYYIERALKSNEHERILLFNKGILLYHLDRMDEAIKTMDSMLYQNPDFLLGWISRGVMTEVAGTAEEAITYYDQGLKRDPKNVRLWTLRGRAQFSLSRYDEAVRCFTQALKFQADLDFLWLCKGITLTSLKRGAEASQCFAHYREMKKIQTDEEPEKLTALPEYKVDDLMAMIPEEMPFTLKVDPLKVFFRF